MASSLVAPILPTPPARLTESVDEFCTYMKIGVDHIMTSLETPILSTADYGSLYNTVFNFFTATHFQYEVEQHRKWIVVFISKYSPHSRIGYL